MEEPQYKCNTCQWQGPLSELNWDTVETCMGNDEIEVCPKCGSFDVNLVREEKR